MRPVHVALVFATVVIGTPSAYAQHRHHHSAYLPAYDYGWEHDAVRDATIRAQREPGLAQEIDPSSAQTATGGPSGGLQTPF